MRAWWILFLCTCTAAPRTHPADQGDIYRAVNLSIYLAFNTGPSWWTDPDKECPVWSQALPIARQLAGCSEDYVGDPANKCQVAIRRCSPGCDVCRNLKPGSGPDTTFGTTRQPYGETCYATTWGPGFVGGYDTRFDIRFICSDAKLLAKVMIHESSHACRAAGGTIDLRDERDPFRLGVPGCYADTQVALFKGDKECGDPP